MVSGYQKKNPPLKGRTENTRRENGRKGNGNVTNTNINLNLPINNR